MGSKTTPAKKTGQKESEVLKECLSYLRSLVSYRVTAQRNNTGSGDLRGTGGYYQYGIKDAGDIICNIDGKYVEIECKHGSGGRLSPGQSDHAERIRRQGGCYFVVHSLDELKACVNPLLPDIIAELDSLNSKMRTP